MPSELWPHLLVVFVTYVNTINLAYVDLSTYYILTIQKIFVGILSNIPNIISLLTCLSISLTIILRYVKLMF
jgi:hypothetical protein